jgi:ketosteroid isomerase-like protein
MHVFECTPGEEVMKMQKSLDTVRAYYEAIGRHDVDAIVANLTEDCEIELLGPPSIPFAGKYSGAGGMRDVFDKLDSSSEILRARRAPCGV